MTIPIKIEPMRLRHVPAILRIERSVFTTPWTEEMFRQEIEGYFGSHVVVGTLDHRVVGYEIAWFLDEEVHLVNIAVDKTFQRRGIGSTLLRYLIDRASEEGKQSITLEVRASNAIAQGLYRAFSFRTIGVRRGYYSDNREDAHLMYLNLERNVHRRQHRDRRTGAR